MDIIEPRIAWFLDGNNLEHYHNNIDLFERALGTAYELLIPVGSIERKFGYLDGYDKGMIRILREYGFELRGLKGDQSIIEDIKNIADDDFIDTIAIGSGDFDFVEYIRDFAVLKNLILVSWESKMTSKVPYMIQTLTFNGNDVAKFKPKKFVKEKQLLINDHDLHVYVNIEPSADITAP